jgi:sec-independent protein translocase protein TatB
MFDIGGGEFVVIGIVALVAIGPKELPTVLRTVGRYMGKIKRMSAEFQGQFQEALREAELSDLTKHAEDLKSTVSDFTSFDPMADTTAHMPAEGGTAEAVAAAAAADMAAAGPATGEPLAADMAAAGPATGEPLAAETAAAETHAPDIAATSIDLPMPEPLPPVTNADFAPVEPTPTAEPSAAEAPKRAGDGA